MLEGVMMKNGDRYAVAVRKPDHQIEVKTDTFQSLKNKLAIFKLPIFRGAAAFFESMVLGIKTLNYSTSFYEDEPDKKAPTKKDGILDAGVVVLSFLLAIAIFVAFPLFVSSLLTNYLKSQTLQLVVEGVLRILMFIGYVLLISVMNDIRRVFMYHGAEHKCINCVEHGYELTVPNVRKQPREHKRCGTSFLLVVMLVSFVLFMFIRVETVWLRYVLRIALIPVISGISYEFIRLAGRTDNRVINLLSKPGLLLQSLTTKEPDDEMIQVAIASVEAVFNWRAFQEKEGLSRNKSKKNAKSTKSASSKDKQKNGKSMQKADAPDVLAFPENTSDTAGEIVAAKDIAVTADTAVRKDMAGRRKFNMDVVSMSAPAEEEEDEVLKALDRYFVYEGEKTVIETVLPPKRERKSEEN